MVHPKVNTNALVVEGENAPLSADVVADVLSDSCRRAALSSLLEHESNLKLDELLNELIATATTPITEDERHDHLRIQFHHVHLPKLRDAGVIEYRRDSEVIEVQPVIDELKPFLK